MSYHIISALLEEEAHVVHCKPCNGPRIPSHSAIEHKLLLLLELQDALLDGVF